MAQGNLVWISWGPNTYGLADDTDYRAWVGNYQGKWAYRTERNGCMSLVWGTELFDTLEEAQAMAVVAYKMGG